MVILSVQCVPPRYPAEEGHFQISLVNQAYLRSLEPNGDKSEKTEQDQIGNGEL
jgi:hypothetical protein